MLNTVKLYMTTDWTVPGCDQSWTIGTQLRQRKMHESAISNPQQFRNVLIDDLQRTNYIHDAEVVQRTSNDTTENQKGSLLILAIV